jgi:hypothetical protein
VLVLTPAQRKTSEKLWPGLAYGGAGGVPVARLRTGKIMNHLEVNALVTGSSVRLQFSSREGFGLVVTEAMIKKPEPPFGVVVATLVGGICDQITEDSSADTTESSVALPTPYPAEGIRSSLGEYQALPEDDGEAISPQQSRELFDRISSRASVRQFAAQMARAFEMTDGDRRSMAKAAFRRAQDLFSTPANVRGILETFADAAIEG